MWSELAELLLGAALGTVYFFWEDREVRRAPNCLFDLMDTDVINTDVMDTDGEAGDALSGAQRRAQGEKQPQQLSETPPAA